MTGPTERVREGAAMIAQMAPVLDPVLYVFCGVEGGHGASAAALATFREDEELTLILPVDVAHAHGLTVDLPMARITLSVHSALDGVGLTAAVASALADADIACNMVAAYHHDHAFVPAERAEEAMSLLQRLSGAPHR